MTGRASPVGGSTPGPRSPRDRHVDLLRVVSLSMVVIGHWLAVVVTWEGGTITGENALKLVPDMWPLTWVFQVMPLFFFVGGFANRKSYESIRRRGGGYVAFVTRRLERLLTPTIAFLAIGLATATILDALGLIEDLLRPAARVVTLPLWFLGVYTIVLALTPPMLWLHRRYGSAVIAAFVTAAAAVDLLRFGVDAESVGYLNYAFVWLVVHQLGFVHDDGDVQRFAAPLAVGGFGILVALVALGPYPASLVGISSNEIDNMNPPTLVILALAACQIGVALLARASLSRWLERDRVWRLVVGLNLRIMTVFLWHLAAILPTIAIIYPLGFPQPDPGSAAWWALRPVWIALQIPVLALLVVLFGRFEAMGRRTDATSPEGETTLGRAMAGVGALYAGLGVVAFARLGLEPVHSDRARDVTVIDVNSARGSIHLVLAVGLLWAAAGGPRSARRVTIPAVVVLVLLAAAGPLDSGLLATEGPETVLHAVSAAVLLVANVMSVSGPPMSPTRRESDHLEGTGQRSRELNR